MSELSGVPEFQTTSIAERLPSRVSDVPAGGEAAPLWLNLSASPGTSVDVASLQTLSGAGLLVGMSRLSLGDLSTFAAAHPAQIDALLSSPPASTAVTEWWSGLGAESRTTLARAVPRLVGNLDGVPARQRATANLRYLGRTLSDVRADLADATGPERTRLEGELAVLRQVKEALRPSEGGPLRSLILLDTLAGGRAAIALGDPDTADYLSYLVPGMNYGVREQLVNWATTADDLYREQAKVLARRTAHGEPRPTVATIAWIGYETPDLFSVGGLDRAEAGADFLEDSWLGVRSARGAEQPFLSVFGHSYGTTVSLTALARGSVGVDAFVMVGSPGSGIQSVAELSVAHGNVFVGEADWDPAVNSAFFGSDPGAAAYGAHTLGVDGARDRVTGKWLNGSLGHNAYFTPGSESLHNMALIGTDNAKLATNGSE
ncbi:alpha/beta hydrolase [Cryobacterium tagatosivorans]|uniref:alpha/beta hydrolase n=1 Tax=Cryobacterium tagatosivorans TaxID=1259199 RepID=UPI00141B256C|nr:alpha/beta hydrolase [Cryobacterium tagatosivorans]